MDLDDGMLHIKRSWDDKAGEGEPKTRAAIRRVPIIAPLAGLLRARAHRGELVFGVDGKPFEPTTVRLHALEAWETAGLEPITLHEARHSYASFLIASGVDLKAITSLLGHSSVRMSIDLYGHLLAGGEAAAGQRLESFLTAPSTSPRTP